MRHPWARDRATVAPMALALLSVLTGCAPVDDPSLGLSVAETVALIDGASRLVVMMPGVVVVTCIGTEERPFWPQMGDLTGRPVGPRATWSQRVFPPCYAEPEALGEYRPSGRFLRRIMLVSKTKAD